MAGQQREGGESSRSHEDDWTGVTDQLERRKIQNRNAQRKFREKSKRQREDEARISENQQVAGSAYTAPDARDLTSNSNPTGLPWGSVSIEHVVEAGKAKEKQSQQASREGSASAAQGQGSARGSPFLGVGLHLSERWARRRPTWNDLKWRSSTT